MVFLLLVPVLASMGTNTTLYGRIACFMGAWVFLLVMNEGKIKENLSRWVLIASFMCLAAPMAYNTACIYMHHNKYYTSHLEHGSENAKALSLTTQQVAYYERVYDLCQQYGYQPKKSVLFASKHDWATAYIWDLRLSNEFQLSTIFKFLPEEEFLLPDFIILTDEEKLLYDFEKFSWGWPEQYDVYQIGSPESLCNKFNGGEGKIRWMYCRK